jgi:hypothetical protein
MALTMLVSTAETRALYDKKDSFKFLGDQRLVDPPAHCLAAHRVGKISLAISNNATLGVNYTAAQSVDCFTNRSIGFSCEVPKNSGVEYVYGGSFWIGAVVGRDTLVTVGFDGWQSNAEFNPDPSPNGDMIKRSIIDPTDFELYEDAISEEDYIAQYTDTSIENVTGTYDGNSDPSGHRPIGIEVIQRSYAWSYEYAEDFVLFDYSIENIGTRALREVYMGVYVDADVGADQQTNYLDDVCGFIPEFLDTHLTCEFIDAANIAWIADNDGDIGGAFQPSPHVTGTRIIRTPAESLDVSFNWWVGNGAAALDFGPREQPNKGKLAEPHRDFGTGGLGTPEGDRNKYYSLRNQEFDYDQVFTAIVATGRLLDLDTLFLAPNPTLKGDLADGFDTRYLLSFGPFNIDPGEVLPLSFAYVAGLNLHSDPQNVGDLPGDPEGYYQGVNFKDLLVNARWAEWVYDNPGVDTDSDGFAGIMRFCPIDSIFCGIDTVVNPPADTSYDSVFCYTVVDTTFSIGDGVPDFRGASPPPAPQIFIEPKIGEIKVRFNGYRSETTRDPFSRSFDFEGYSIYVGRDDRSSSYSKLVSYDLENFNKWTFNATAIPPVFQLKDEPFSYDELFNLYAFGDSTFDPLKYTINRPYRHPFYPESTFYFERQGFNASSLTEPNGIQKVYPSQPYPSTLVLDSLPAIEKTPDGYPKYFEYEYTVTSLLPTVPYWISVTAFDFGSPASGLPSLETNVTQNTANAYPLETWAAVDAQDLEVFVYPNPYRGDANYRARGYEGVDTTGRRLSQSDRPDDRARQIHFANVPPNCIISIFSLDGDLVREIVHNSPPADPNASHATWDLITRNTQAVVSGLYYWTVENSDSGEIQMGKLVIIM